MRTNAHGTGSVASILAQLEPVLTAERRDAAVRLRSRLLANQFRVLVVGEAKRGKSTFVNALIAREVLPMGVLPVTAIVTTLTAGSPEGVTVTFKGGRREHQPLSALASFVTETENPRNTKGVTTVTATLQASLLSGGLQLVDTPGTGSVFEHNTREAEHGLDDVDAAVFVVTSDPPISAAETQLLRTVLEHARFVMFVLNKTDYLTPDDLRQVHDFTTRTLAGIVGNGVEIYPCSATKALSARREGDDTALRESGVAAFETAFRERIAAVRDTVLPMSIATHALRLLGSQRDDTELALRVRRLRATDEAHLVEDFRHDLDAALARQSDLRALVEARRRVLADELSGSAERFRRRLAKEVLAALDEFVDADEQASLSSGELERSGHRHASGVIRPAIEAWLRAQTSAVDDGLVKLRESLAADVNESIERVRAAGHTILNINLLLGHEPPRLPASVRFHFDFSEDVGQTELLAGTLRAIVPGRAGRRRALAWLDRDARDQVDRHVGRARSDLADRLASACRELAEQVSDELSSLAQALRDVLDDADTTGVTVNEQAQQESRLRDILDTLDNLGAELCKSLSAPGIGPAAAALDRTVTAAPQPGRAP